MVEVRLAPTRDGASEAVAHAIDGGTTEAFRRLERGLTQAHLVGGSLRNVLGLPWGF